MINKYTWLGFSSILIWACLVAVVKLITEQVTPISGVALIYSFSALAILAFSGVPSIKSMPKKYLYGCGILFICYEILFLISVALSHNHEQVLIIAMINYLWPPITIIFSILAKQLNFKAWVFFGFILAVIGLLLVVNPKILEFENFIHVLSQNPIAYAFAFLGALLWPCYSVFTKKYAEGANAVPLFFVVTAVALWGVHFVSHESFIMPSMGLWGTIAVTGSLIGLAYSNWNQSLQFGNIQLLILATYFMPVLSSIMSMLILGVSPLMTFWIGSALVTLGALICWKSTSAIE